MQIICVDDEELVLGLNVSLCRDLPQHPDVEGFRFAEEALEWLKKNQADIALLDINMPDMDGITLAAKIKEICGGISVIFLTGYSEYAVDAFQMHASGYLLKPVNSERLTAEIDFALRGNHRQKKNEHIFARTFGEFDLLIDGKPVVFSRSRAKELLAYLIDRQGGYVTRANAFAALWEDGIYDRSMQKQFDVVIRSLRSTLEQYGASEILEINKGSMRVCPEEFECDLYRFFKGDIDSIDAYHGEYMSAYSWASLTESYMDRINHRI